MKDLFFFCRVSFASISIHIFSVPWDMVCFFSPSWKLLCKAFGRTIFLSVLLKKAFELCVVSWTVAVCLTQKQKNMMLIPFPFRNFCFCLATSCIVIGLYISASVILSIELVPNIIDMRFLWKPFSVNWLGLGLDLSQTNISHPWIHIENSWTASCAFTFWKLGCTFSFPFIYYYVGQWKFWQENGGREGEWLQDMTQVRIFRSIVYYCSVIHFRFTCP